MEAVQVYNQKLSAKALVRNYSRVLKLTLILQGFDHVNDVVVTLKLGSPCDSGKVFFCICNSEHWWGRVWSEK